MKCIVTGGAGFIASHVVDLLLKENHRVAVIDDLSLNGQENIKQYANNPSFSFYHESILHSLDHIFEKEKPDWVFHLAALPRVQFSMKHPQKTHEVNVTGTLNMLLVSKKFNVKRFIFTSSSSIYGDQPSLPFVETMSPNPMSPYALHKLIGEHYCALFTKIYGLETISLRYFNVFGPRQNPAGDYACLIPRFITKFKKGETPIINGTGNNTRDFTYVKDVARANLLAATTKNVAAIGESFNIGNGQKISVNTVAQTLKKLLKSNSEPTHGPAVIEPKKTLADTTKAQQLLGWKPKYSFEQGLEETLASFSS